MATTTIHTLAYKIVADSSKFKSEMARTNAEIRAGKAVTEQFMPALKKHEMEIEALGVLYKKGRIDLDTYNRALRAHKQAMSEATVAGRAWKTATGAMTSKLVALAGAYVSFHGVLKNVMDTAKEVKEIGDLSKTFNLPIDEIDKLNFAVKREGGGGLDTIQQMAKHLGQLQDKIQEGDVTRVVGETKKYKAANSELKTTVSHIKTLDDRLEDVNKQYARAQEELRRFDILNKNSFLSKSEKFRRIDLVDSIKEIAGERKEILAEQMALESQRFSLMGTIAEEAAKANDTIVTKHNEIKQAFDKYGLVADDFFKATLPDKMLMVAEAVSHIESGEQKLSAINELLGKGASQWADGILKGKEGLQEMFEEYERNVQKISPDLVAKSEALIQATRELNDAWVSFSRTLTEVLGPTLTDALQLAKSALEVMNALNWPGRVTSELDSMFPGRPAERKAALVQEEENRIVKDFSRIKKGYGLPEASPLEIERIRQTEAAKQHEVANAMLAELRRLNGFVDPANDVRYYSNETPALGN